MVECLCHVLLEATCSQNTANYIISFTLETKCVLIGARSQRVSEEIIHPFLLLFLSGLRQTPKKGISSKRVKSLFRGSQLQLQKRAFLVSGPSRSP